MVRCYLEKPLTVGPLGSTYVHIEEKDVSGGFGVNLIVRWKAARVKGVGLPAGLDWRGTSSLGLRLVQMLSKQLDAGVEVHQIDGTEFAVSIPVDRMKDDS
jgi:two-component sensor histidine kinase